MQITSSLGKVTIRVRLAEASEEQGRHPPAAELRTRAGGPTAGHKGNDGGCGGSTR